MIPALRLPATFTPYDVTDAHQAATLADYEGDLDQFRADRTLACDQCGKRWFVGDGVVDWYHSPFDDQLASSGIYVCRDCAVDAAYDVAANERFYR